MKTLKGLVLGKATPGEIELGVWGWRCYGEKAPNGERPVQGRI